MMKDILSTTYLMAMVFMLPPYILLFLSLRFSGKRWMVTILSSVIAWILLGTKAYFLAKTNYFIGYLILATDLLFIPFLILTVLSKIAKYEKKKIFIYIFIFYVTSSVLLTFGYVYFGGRFEPKHGQIMQRR